MVFEGFSSLAPGASPGACATGKAGRHPVRKRLVEKQYLADLLGLAAKRARGSSARGGPGQPPAREDARGEGRRTRCSDRVEVLASDKGYSLVRCSLFTGRQHQIRVHLAAHGCPVVGDKLYGPDDRLLARAADGLLTEEDLKSLELPAACATRLAVSAGARHDGGTPRSASLPSPPIWRILAAVSVGGEPPTA